MERVILKAGKLLLKALNNLSDKHKQILKYLIEIRLYYTITIMPIIWLQNISTEFFGSSTEKTVVVILVL